LGFLIAPSPSSGERDKVRDIINLLKNHPEAFAKTPLLTNFFVILRF
jgi:hypothetical protein